MRKNGDLSRKITEISQQIYNNEKACPLTVKKT